MIEFFCGTKKKIYFDRITDEKEMTGSNKFSSNKSDINISTENLFFSSKNIYRDEHYTVEIVGKKMFKF